MAEVLSLARQALPRPLLSFSPYRLNGRLGALNRLHCDYEVLGFSRLQSQNENSQKLVALKARLLLAPPIAAAPKVSD